MKKLSVLFLGGLFATSAMAKDTLQCWKVDFHPKTPFLTATILSNSKLEDIQFHYKETQEEDTLGKVKGDKITSNHSPYKGNNEYTLKNGHRLILPLKLDAASLKKTKKKGIGGPYKGENGVIIGDFSTGDGEGGTHYSVRLDCTAVEE